MRLTVEQIGWRLRIRFNMDNGDDNDDGDDDDDGDGDDDGDAWRG